MFPGTHGVPDDDDDEELDEEDDPDELDEDEPDEDEDELDDEDELEEDVVPGSVSPQPTAATKLAPSSVTSAAGPIEKIREWRFMVFLEAREEVRLGNRLPWMFHGHLPA